MFRNPHTPAPNARAARYAERQSVWRRGGSERLAAAQAKCDRRNAKRAQIAARAGDDRQVSA